MLTSDNLNNFFQREKKIKEILSIKLQQTVDKLEETQNLLLETKKMASLGNLVAGVAHEINTPIGICITGSSALIQETKDIADSFLSEEMSKSDLKKYLEYVFTTAKLILSNMERAGNLVNSFKQTSIDQISEKKKQFYFKKMLIDSINSIYPTIKNSVNNIEINIECDENLLIHSYPGVFSQIIINLVLNTIIHGFHEKNRGKITIIAIMNEAEFCMEYFDDGNGINEAIISKIFDPFFTTNKKSGSGLGLHIVYNIVTHQLKGKIECSSQKDQGVLFKLTIPAPLVRDENPDT